MRFEKLKIFLDLEVKISMIRFWNYNCSRTKSYRGVKTMALLDQEMNLLFLGEIKRANGTIGKRFH